ncbi:MAG: hypothetical protein J7K22_04320 [Nanoarchaeota archaeon]|nr:hypothetical protein [Nanoarchaeota archaeon]
MAPFLSLSELVQKKTQEENEKPDLEEIFNEAVNLLKENNGLSFSEIVEKLHVPRAIERTFLSYLTKKAKAVDTNVLIMFDGERNVFYYNPLCSAAKRIDKEKEKGICFYDMCKKESLNCPLREYRRFFSKINKEINDNELIEILNQLFYLRRHGDSERILHVFPKEGLLSLLALQKEFCSQVTFVDKKSELELVKSYIKKLGLEQRVNYAPNIKRVLNEEFDLCIVYNEVLNHRILKRLKGNCKMFYLVNVNEDRLKELLEQTKLKLVREEKSFNSSNKYYFLKGVILEH